MTADVELAVMTATFDATDDSAATLAGALARYVVLTRNEPACRNVDLLVSATHRGRFLVVEKWESPAALRAHLDSELMTGMARAVVPLLAGPPSIDWFDAVSAHDLL